MMRRGSRVMDSRKLRPTVAQCVHMSQGHVSLNQGQGQDHHQIMLLGDRGSYTWTTHSHFESLRESETAETRTDHHISIACPRRPHIHAYSIWCSFIEAE